MLGPAETAEREADQRQINREFAGVSLTPEMAVELGIAPQPAEGALHGPSSRKPLERVALGVLHDFTHSTSECFGAVDQDPGIAAVGQEVLDAPAGRLIKARGEQLLGTSVTLNVVGQLRRK